MAVLCDIGPVGGIFYHESDSGDPVRVSWSSREVTPRMPGHLSNKAWTAIDKLTDLFSATGTLPQPSVIALGFLGLANGKLCIVQMIKITDWNTII